VKIFFNRPTFVPIHTSVSFKRKYSNRINALWKLLLVAYPRVISGYDIERIIKFGQYLLTLQ